MSISLPIRIILTIVYLVSLYFVVFWFLVLFDNKIVPHKKKRIKDWPTVTIGIPAYNEAKKESAEGLTNSIKSILELDYPKDKLEIIAVNHGSTDDTLKVLEQFKDRINIITIDRSPMDMKGVPTNIALKKAKGEFFVTFDADSLVDKDGLKKLLPYFVEKNIAAVLPIMKVWKTGNMLQKFQWYEFLVNGFYKKIMGKLNCVHVCPGPFSVFRTKALRNVGGFDPYGLTDDFEMTLRLQKAQYKIIQTTDSCVYSNLPGTPKEMYNQRNRWFLGTLRDIRKHKDMIFNKKYGDFGMMQLPTIIMSGLLAVTVLGVMIYHLIKNSSSWLSYLLTIKFDIATMFRNLRFDIVLLDLNFVNIMIGVIMFSLTIFFFVYAHKHTRERLKNHSVVSLPLFFLTFFFILGVAWAGAIFDFIRGKKRKWRD